MTTIESDPSVMPPVETQPDANKTGSNQDELPQPPLEPSDEGLVARVRQQEQSAFTTLYDRYVRSVYAFAGFMLGSAEAEEVVQEVFLRLWYKADQFDASRGSFKAWFMTIARYHVLDRLRRQGHRQRFEAAEQVDQLIAEWVDPAAVDAEAFAALQARNQLLQQALNRLPAEQRRVIILAYFGGLTHAALAKYLGWPLGTVKKRIRLGLQKLRTFLTEQGLSPEFPEGPNSAEKRIES